MGGHKKSSLRKPYTVIARNDLLRKQTYGNTNRFHPHNEKQFNNIPSPIFIISYLDWWLSVCDLNAKLITQNLKLNNLSYDEHIFKSTESAFLL